MKSWALAAILVSAGAIAACSSDNSGGGGSGGAGGATSSSSSTTSSTSSTTSGTGGSAPACDNNPDGCGDKTMEPSGCLACATKGPCADELGACQQSMDCVALVTCLSMCMAMDDACVTKCNTDHAEGSMIYNNIVKCAVCQACPHDCAASASPLCK